MHLTEAYLEPSRTSSMEMLCKNSEQLKTVDYFRKKAPSQMLDRVLNTPLSRTFHRRLRLLVVSFSHSSGLAFTEQKCSFPSGILLVNRNKSIFFWGFVYSYKRSI